MHQTTRGHSVKSLAHIGEEAEQEQLLTWHTPRVNIYRCAATFWSFLVMGFVDGSYGALLPYLETYYTIDYLVVSLVFLSPCIGYSAAALLNNSLHMRFGQRGVALLAPSCHLLAAIVIALHPPFPVTVVVCILAGLGNGLVDSSWNAWIGAMQNANELMGFLHGIYGLGAAIAPLIATALITKLSKPWYYWYYLMIGAAFVELVTSLHAFWGATGAVFRSAHPSVSSTGDARLKEATLRRPAARVSWLAALFLFGHVGVEIALGGWVHSTQLFSRKRNDSINLGRLI